MPLPKKIQSLIQELGRLPGIGPKAAWRMAFWILKNPTDLAPAILELKKNVESCSDCRSLVCLCAARKDQKKLCLVEDDLDLVALEKSGSFQGIYHVLDVDLNISLPRIIVQIKKQPRLEEIIVATNPTTEGDFIALKIKRALKEKFPELVFTRLGRGLPTGADIEYADQETLTSSLENRKEI